MNLGQIVKAGSSAVQRISRNVGNGRDAYQAFGVSADMTGILNTYFPAIDFGNLQNLTPDDLADLRDTVNQFQWFIDNLKEIEDLMVTYIRNQVTFNDFKARLVKEGFKGAEKIEKSVLDVFLAHHAYTDNRRLLTKQSDNKIAQMKTELENAFEIEDASLNSSLVIAATRQARKLREIQGRPAEQERLDAISEEQRLQKQSIKDRIKYGTAGNPRTATTNKQSGGGFFNRVVNFFS